MIVVSCLAWATSLAAVVAAQALGWDLTMQTFAGLAGLVAILGGAATIDPGWAGPRRTGKQIAANVVVLICAIGLAMILREQVPDDYPIYVVGFVVPLFLAAELAVDWHVLGRRDGRPLA
jgi:hypothetical protein